VTAQKLWRTAEVLAVADAAEAVRRITLKMPSPVREPLEGAHLDVAVQVDGRTETRSYSVVSGDTDPCVLHLGVQLAPASRGGSRYMHALRAGTTLRVTQPLNNFAFRRSRGPLRFLAGGIGVTALVSMAASAARSPAHPDYTFTYVARRKSVMPFLNELTASHGEVLTLHTDEEHGRFNVAGFVADCPSETNLYVCGPIGMLEAVRAAWTADGRPDRLLRFETFGTAGKYPATPFMVHVPAEGLSVEVGRGQSILEALEGAGADVMFDCRKGECGLCQVDICEVRGVVDHRDVFFSDRQHQSCQRLCTCVTRIAATDDQPAPAVTLSLP
jgi:ferredoxin-NADP reductase